MRAYVTGGAPASYDAREAAMRAHYGLTPRRARTSSMARGTRAARRPWRTHRLAAAFLGVGLGWRPTTSAMFRRRRGGSGGNAQSQRVARWSPSFRRGRAKEARARTVAPLPLPWGCT